MIHETKANRGQTYRITFNDAFEATLVESRVSTGGLEPETVKHHWRKVWSSGKDMSTTAACAIRSALRDLGRM